MNKTDQLRKALGNKVRTVRESKNLTIRALAVLAGMEHSTIHRIENGDMSPTVITIQKLADALEITPCAFFDC